ncbi:MAG: SRPBCC family protein [Patescibacteria group bacterium]
MCKPANFLYSRSLEIKAPADKIFPLINDFKEWVKWSPYEKKDLNMSKEFSGSQSGVGAKYAWSGKKSGVGKMEIVESASPIKINIKLSFTKPMKAENDALFMLESLGETTKVTWTMSGQQPMIARFIGMFINMDKLIAKDFEAGLKNLAAEVEA